MFQRVRESLGELLTEEEAKALVDRAIDECLFKRTSNRDMLISAIAKAMAGMNRLKIAEAIIDGRLHAAISIDWSKVA